jgi:hypothetical protein
MERRDVQSTATVKRQGASEAIYSNRLSREEYT